MNRSTLSATAVAVALTSACGGAVGLGIQPSYGIVVKYEAMPGTTIKRGIDALSDTGRRLFGPSSLVPPTKIGFGGGTSSYGGADVPRWVEISWRTGEFVQRYDPSTNSMWTGGTIIERHRIEVASRLPPEVLKYASGRGRAIRLIFRLKDDGVLLAWDVQESVRHPRGGSGWVYSLHGGDFTCAELAKPIGHENCTSGYLKDASWYNPLWTSD